MTARCGSFDRDHRAKTCRACQAIYRNRTRSGATPFRTRFLVNAAVCEFCEIVSGNSKGVPVYRYTIRRALTVGGKRTSRSIGSIGMCDSCAVERGIVKRGLLHQRLSERDDGLRANDLMPASLGS